MLVFGVWCLMLEISELRGSKGKGSEDLSLRLPIGVDQFDVGPDPR